MMLTIRQLRCLDALASAEHFGRAAERVGVTQPALSAQIKQMEVGLGVTLFDRLPSGARPTAAGREIAQRVSSVLAEISDIEAYARSLAGPLAGPMTLGIIPSIGPYVLPRLLPVIAERFPDLRLQVRETMTETLVNELVQGDLDMIVASIPLEHPGITEVPIHRDLFRLAVPMSSPIADDRRVTLDDIAEDELLLLEEGHCLRDQVLSACGTGLKRGAGASGLTNLSTILELVAAGQGITLLPDLFVTSADVARRRITLVDLADPTPERMVGCAWRRRNPREAAFRSVADAIADSLRGLIDEDR